MHALIPEATDCATLELPGPRSVRSAYGGIIRKVESPREIERRVFAEVTVALEEADAPGATSSDRIDAAHRNRELWFTLACDAAADANPLPETLRAGIINLAIWVCGETSRVLRDGTPLRDLITTNYTIIQGLTPAPLPEVA
jgi:flagellar protein FlaF